jgi:hypothetical protein
VCGKFTALASWAQVVAFSQPLTINDYDGSNDHSVALEVMGNLNVIVWGEQEQRRLSVRSDRNDRLCSPRIRS